MFAAILPRPLISDPAREASEGEEEDEGTPRPELPRERGERPVLLLEDPLEAIGVALRPLLEGLERLHLRLSPPPAFALGLELVEEGREVRVLDLLKPSQGLRRCFPSLLGGDGRLECRSGNREPAKSSERGFNGASSGNLCPVPLEATGAGGTAARLDRPVAERDDPRASPLDEWNRSSPSPSSFSARPLRPRRGPCASRTSSS